MSAIRGVNVDAMIGMSMVLYGDSCIDESFIFLVPWAGINVIITTSMMTTVGTDIFS